MDELVADEATRRRTARLLRSVPKHNLVFALKIEIIAGGEAVFCDQRLPARLSSHAGRCKENLAAHRW